MGRVIGQGFGAAGSPLCVERKVAEVKKICGPMGKVKSFASQAGTRG